MTHPAPSGVVTLLTDFGVEDPFVGVMKGVILAVFPHAAIVDLSHAIAPQDVSGGAFWLERSFQWFAEGTVHVAVVDPGVGSRRAPLVMWAAGHYFVGPDNGILGGVQESAVHAEIREIDVPALGRTLNLARPSNTFHGRDIFAPAAAGIASGALAPGALGPTRDAIEPSPIPRPRVAPGRIEGAVVCIDRFGNILVNIDAACLASLRNPRAQVAGIELPLLPTYSAVARGDHLALVNSFGALEIARRDGHAAKALGVTVGTQVVVIHDIYG